MKEKEWKQLEFNLELTIPEQRDLVFKVTELTKEFFWVDYRIQNNNEYFVNNLFLLEDKYKQLVSANNQLHLQTDSYIKHRYKELEPIIKIYKDIRDYE